MSNYIIENDLIKATITSTGAELVSLINKRNNKELIWQGDEKFWSRHSPLLFPHVGRVNQDQYQINGKKYSSTQHGFVRDAEFVCAEEDGNALTFELYDSDKTLEKYPFHFRLEAAYRTEGRKLIVSWNVKNTGNETMYFSIGAHPAFNTEPEKKDYSLYFPEKDSLTYHLLDLESSSVTSETHEMKLEDHRLHLNNQMFEIDTFIFDDYQISEVTLEKNDGEKIVTVHSPNFPNFGIWSIPDAPYVCLEPWVGRADDFGFEAEFSTKPNIVTLEPGKDFYKEYSIEVC